MNDYKKLIIHIILISLCCLSAFGQNPKSPKLAGAPTPPPFPEILPIPDQLALPGDTFPKLNLSDYLKDIDPEDVGWSYRFSHELNNDTTVNWTEPAPSGFSGSMTMVTQIEARDTFPIAMGHKIAAFHNGEIRGVGNALNAGSKWLFYITIFGNQVLDSLTFKYYHADQKSVFAIEDTILFIPDNSIGHIDNPHIMKAGYITMELQDSTICPQVIDKEWEGRDTIYVMARGLGSTVFADTAMVVYYIGEDYELPLELLSFTGEKIDRTSLLRWDIALPENVLGYEIHRANYSPISGNLQWEMIDFENHYDSKFHYSYLDESPDLAKNYYRLKIVDLDGSYEWSPIVSLDFESERNYEVSFFPNPSLADVIYLDLVTEVPTLVDVAIFNQIGQAQLKIRMDTDGQRMRLPIDISDFAAGIYLARFKIGKRVLNSNFVVVSP